MPSVTSVVKTSATHVPVVSVGEALGERGIDAGGSECGDLDAHAAIGLGVHADSRRVGRGRSANHAAVAVRRGDRELAERDGATIRTADGTGEGDAPEAVLMRRIVDAFAEYERLLIRARTKAALAVKKVRGERTGDIPYGSRLASDGVHLEQHDAEQQMIEMVKRHRDSGLSLRAIGARLDATGIRPRGGGRWHPQTVANVLAGRMAA